ncbi:MAG: NAD(P)/FAD-dependent oxidoreductase [Proteobacteria bacterium]|nr:NAD(P)/FAD-dependent oxidoreductase [Pseudomonadota bacterium]MBU1716767.1 NAD(P)/FAD-dependent oxidoreductase [Pseudomonadota bacterium]
MTENITDVLIIGAGPAGLQAAVHAVRKKASVVVLGRAERSSIYQAHVENYLCVDGVTEGSELMRVALGQAGRFGAVLLPEDVMQIEQQDGLFMVKSESKKHLARTIIIATGTSRKKLKVKGEKELVGRGVSYCVDCDANFFRNAKVAVVGNESAAVDGALTLTGYASEVYLIAKELSVTEELRQKLSQSKVQLKEGAWVGEIIGENAVTGIMLEDNTTLEVEGVFVELGAKGAMELAVNLGVQLDTETFTHIQTDKKQATNVGGIFAAGDICGHPYQMAKAVGEGCVAGLEAANYARRQKKEGDEV